jgi:hypothetical protein
LAEHFVASGFDMKDLVRTICRSNVYQLSAEPNAYNQNARKRLKPAWLGVARSARHAQQHTIAARRAAAAGA